MDDSDTLPDGQHDDRPRSSGGAVKSNPTDGGSTEDALEHLSPGERFARALERRDALIRKLSQAGKKS